jgi:Transglutaminase-like superfamily
MSSRPPVIARFLVFLALYVEAQSAFGTPQAALEEVPVPRQGGHTLTLPVPRTLELTHIDPAAFAAALDRDENRIFAFVRDEIAYEPYIGCLRGPQGTLMARAGNSVDRAVLLAGLMQAAGKHVRFAHGDLGEKEAAELVQAAWADRPVANKTSTSASESVKKAFGLFQTARTRDFHLATEQLKQAPLVQSELTTTNMANLVKMAEAHFWIQYEKDGAWIDMDPSFARAGIGQTYAVSSQVLEKLPENLFHQLTVRVVVEEIPGGASELTPTPRETLRYTSRSSDLAAVDLVLMHRGQGGKKPDGLAGALGGAGKDNGRVKPALFIPNGKWITGSEFETRAPKTSLGGLGSMRDMLGGAGTRKQVPVAVAERLEFEFMAPDGSKEMVVRDVFDLVGPARRSNNSPPVNVADISASAQPVAEELVGSVYDIFFTNGRLDEANFQDLSVEPPPTGKKHIDLRRMLRRINITFTALSDRLASVKWGDRSVTRIYPDSPRVTILALTGLHKGPALSIDLRRNQVRAITTGAHPEDAFSSQLLRGINDGTLERTFLETITTRLRERAKVGPTMSTSTIFEKAVADKLPFSLWKSGNEEMPFAVQSKDTAARLAEEHRAGAWLLGPSRELNLNSRDRFAWWRIDPRSGVTMAVTDDGLHQDATEKVVVTTSSDDTVIVTVGTEAEGGTMIGNPAFTQEFEDMEDAKSYIDWLHSQGYPGGGEGLTPPGVIPQSPDIPTAAFPK